MDLSLHGSQINLVQRSKKPKPKPILTNYQRPFSASTLYGRRSFSRSSQNSSISSTSSVFLPSTRKRRPVSADEKLAESIQNCVRFSDKIALHDRKLLKPNKKFYSNNPANRIYDPNISSSDLLNLLLNEPIQKRSASSWSYHSNPKRDYRNYSDSGYRSDCSLGEKIQKRAVNSRKSSNSSQNKSKSLKKQDKKDNFYINCDNSSSNIIDEENLGLSSEDEEEEEQDNSISKLRFQTSKTSPNFRKSSIYDNGKTNENLLTTNLHRMSFNSSNNSNNINKYTNQSTKYSQERTNNTGTSAINRGLGNIGSNDFWHSKKPDLPGRVSFGKVTSLNTVEIDYSDYENDNPNEDQLNENNSNRITTTGSSSSATTNKKSVHFGERTEVEQQQQHQQQHQHQQGSSSSASSSTCHQYTSSSCSNEHCPCVCNSATTTKKSPRLKSISYTIPSTSSVSQQNTTIEEFKCCSDNKCMCDYDYSTKSLKKNFPTDFSSFDIEKKYKEERNSSKVISNKDEEDENLIIQNYKDQINDESKKLQLEIKMLEDKDKDIDCSSNAEQHNLSSDHNTSRLSTMLNVDKDNDHDVDVNKYESEYTQIENSSKLQLGQKNTNFSYLHNNNGKDNNDAMNLENNQQMINKDKMTQTLNPIINNYLKVSESMNTNSNSNQRSDDHQSKLTGKVVKKLNNNTATNAQNKRSKKITSSTSTYQNKKSSRSKSVSPGIKVATSTPNNNVCSSQSTLSKKEKNLKKSETFGCLRQNSILDEFHLDGSNIDSWMTIKDENYHHNQKKQHQIQEQYNLHHHHHHYHKGKGDKADEGEDGRNRNQERQRYSRHCHRYEESHYDTDTPEQCSKTTEETTPTTSSSTSSASSASSSSQDGCGRENVNGCDNSGNSSTYDEIVSVIKEIEEEKKKEIPHDNSITDLDIKFQNLLHSDGGTSDISTTRKDGNESPDKLKDILSYLEDVENSCERTLMETTRRSMPETSRSEVEFAVEPDIAENVPKITDLLMIPNHQLARRVVALSLRANELSNAVQLSKENLAQIRQEKQKMIRLEKQNSANRLREQKKYYENMLSRHQGFIEQLLKDKGSLCEKVTALTRRLESQNQSWEHKLETEMARAKEIALAGEKIRRERWVRENTKKIKELTVKGLEAEIEKMNSDHKKEITDLKRQHQQELLDALEEARQKHEQIEKSIRETCAKDRETIIEKERSAIRERFERQLQEEQKSFHEQRSKLLEDFAAERERLLKELRQKDEEFEKKKQELQREKELAVEQAIAECNEKLEQQEQKHQLKINAIEKQFESDFLIWKREFENACKLREVENENGIRQHYRAERDRQIDAIVSRMDAESQKCQEEFELKLSRLKEKYESDLKEVENVEKSLRDKYNETRTRLAESDAQVQNLHAELKQLQLELEHSKKMCDEFLAEKESMKENARNEVQAEIASIKSERDEEIQKIHKRVQHAIEKKDAAMEILQKDNATLRERCIKLEAIIRQQRKDYCIK